MSRDTLVNPPSPPCDIWWHFGEPPPPPSPLKCHVLFEWPLSAILPKHLKQLTCFGKKAILCGRRRTQKIGAEEDGQKSVTNKTQNVVIGFSQFSFFFYPEHENVYWIFIVKYFIFDWSLRFQSIYKEVEYIDCTYIIQIFVETLALSFTNQDILENEKKSALY